MTKVLENRVALVTGAGGGIGRGIALAFAAQGAAVIVAVRRLETGAATVEAIQREGGRASAIVMDVTNEEQVRAGFDQVRTEYGKLDILVHNAMLGASRGGGGTPTALLETQIDHWRAQAAVATGGTFLTGKHGHALLKETGGAFVIMASVAGLEGNRVNPCYAAIKGGQRGMIRALAREWGPDGIRVIGIAPAAETESAKHSFDKNPGLKELISSCIPLRRVGDPRHDIGDAVAVLASEHCRYLTGQTICVDGGMYTAL